MEQREHGEQTGITGPCRLVRESESGGMCGRGRGLYGRRPFRSAGLRGQSGGRRAYGGDRLRAFLRREAVFDRQYAAEGAGAGTGIIRISPSVLRARTGCGDRAGCGRSPGGSGVVSGSACPCQHPDDRVRSGRRQAAGAGRHPAHRARKGTVPCGTVGDPPGFRSGDRVFCARRALLLLFRPVPVQQHSGREKRKPGALRAALPPVLRSAGGTKAGLRGRRYAAESQRSVRH